MIVPSGVDTTIQYLARNELYETEKPYAADFEVNEQTGAQKTNHIFLAQRVWINTIEAPDDFDIDTHGFCVIKAKTNLKPEAALKNPREVEAAYMNEVKAILHRRFPEYSRLEGIDFVVSARASLQPLYLLAVHLQVRQRDERFPSDAVAVVEHEQPACLAHSDFSAHGAILQLKASFPGQEEYFEDKNFDILK